MSVDEHFVEQSRRELSPARGDAHCTFGSFSFSGSKPAAAGGLSVAAATTNGDGPISIRGRSSADRVAHNDEVAGSIPAPVTNLMSGRVQLPAGAKPLRGAAAQDSSFRPPVIFFPGVGVHCANVAEGVHPPGQTEGPSHGHTVRGFDIAFTRNTSPVGFTLNPEWETASHGIRWAWEEQP